MSKLVLNALYNVMGRGVNWTTTTSKREQIDIEKKSLELQRDKRQSKKL